MVNIKKQTIFSVLIAIGAIMLLYDIATENELVELKIGGLVILMVGLYGSTRQWVDDNKKEIPQEEDILPNIGDGDEKVSDNSVNSKNKESKK